LTSMSNDEIQKTVLVVEDEKSSRDLLSRIISKNSLKTMTAENGEEGLKLFRQNPDMVVVTDLEMPIMSGQTMISKIKEIRNDAIIIVQTAKTGSEAIVDVMKLGVYDYFIKPIHPEDFALKLRRSVEANQLRNFRNTVEKEKMHRLESQLEWFRYKDKHSSDSDTTSRGFLHRTLFDSIKTNFTQGAGFGILSSILNLVLISPEDNEGNKIVSKEVVKLIQDNELVVERILNRFSEIKSVIDEGFKVGPASPEELYKAMQSAVASVKRFEDIRGHSVKISDFKKGHKDRKIFFNYDFFKMAVEELIMNAMKFSEKNSSILVIADPFEINFSVSIMNSVSDKYKIPPEYRNLVFEPFFRINNAVHEDYGTLDYGLGLTLVEKIIGKLNGKITVAEVKNFLFGNSAMSEFNILLPYVQ
ncbi:MAG TPA: response regulator, partial [Leptospiraceae bacterium]|nr:response regulator [Leptospiraceae bacterium]